MHYWELRIISFERFFILHIRFGLILISDGKTNFCIKHFIKYGYNFIRLYSTNISHKPASQASSFQLLNKRKFTRTATQVHTNSKEKLIEVRFVSFSIHPSNTHTHTQTCSRTFANSYLVIRSTDFSLNVFDFALNLRKRLERVCVCVCAHWEAALAQFVAFILCVKIVEECGHSPKYVPFGFLTKFNRFFSLSIFDIHTKWYGTAKTCLNFIKKLCRMDPQCTG